MARSNIVTGAHLEGYMLIRKGFIRLAEAQSELSVWHWQCRMHKRSCRSAHHTHTHFKKAPGESCRWKFCYWFCCCLSMCFDQGFVWARDLLQTSKHVCVGLIHDDACISTNRNKMSRPPSRWRNVSKTDWTSFFLFLKGLLSLE